MKLQQIRSLCTIIDEGFSITRAADRLHTSQPGISRQLHELEGELGSLLLTRRSNRTTGLTETGAALLPTARRILRELETMRQIARGESAHSRSRLLVATTHVHGNYTLPPILKRFRARFPQVSFEITYGSPDTIAQWVANGEVDFGISVPTAGMPPGLSIVPCFRLPHCVIVPPRHPLSRAKRPTLEALASYPLITTGTGSRLGRMVLDRFAASGLAPEVAMKVTDLEMIKVYVSQGFGIAVVPTACVASIGADRLRVVEAGHLFEPLIASLIVQDAIPDRPLVDACIDMIRQSTQATPYIEVISTRRATRRRAATVRARDRS